MASSELTTVDPVAQRTLLFRAGDRTFGCGIDAVREIVPQRRATRLPGAPPAVQGLINLRGTIVTVVDLSLWLGGERPAAPDGSIVLVDHGPRVAGVAVDEVLDVQMVAPEDVAGTIGDRNGAVRGMGRLGDTVVILLDITSLVRQALV
ncbi:MAG: chemotaxis protein CheW [Gemmatimonadota bacterium]|nr:chemotaxis protein CheW [Gemmatimonadota bacterium]